MFGVLTAVRGRIKLWIERYRTNFPFLYTPSKKDTMLAIYKRNSKREACTNNLSDCTLADIMHTKYWAKLKHVVGKLLHSVKFVQ